MKFLVNYYPLYLLVFYVIGDLLQQELRVFKSAVSIGVSFACCSALVLFFSFRTQRTPYFLLGASVLCSHLAILLVFHQAPEHKPLYFKNQLQATNYLSLKVNSILRSTARYRKFVATVQQTNGKPSIGKILLYQALDDTRQLHSGSILYVKGTPIPLRDPVNPSLFNYRKHLAKQHIYHLLNIKYLPFIARSPSESNLGIHALHFRDKLLEHLQTQLDTSIVYPMTSALLLGNRYAMNPQSIKAYRQAGAAHILAISGLHIGILSQLLRFFLQLIFGQRSYQLLRVLILILVLGIYVYISGGSPSAIRAWTTLSFIYISRAFKRQVHLVQPCILAMLVLLIANPTNLYNTSFQLSFLAVIGILAIYPRLSNLWTPKNYVLKIVWNSFSISIATQVVLTPIIIFYFHEFSTVFWLTNLCILPFLSAILIIGTFLLIYTSLMAPPEVLLNTYSYLCRGLHQLLMSLGSHDTFIISNLVISKTTVLLLYLIELLLYLLLLNYSQLKSYLLLSAVLLLQLGAIYQKSIRIHAKRLIVFHEHSSSMIGIQRQGVTTLCCSDKIRNPLTVRNYQLWSATSIRYKKLAAAYLIPNHVIFIVGKSGIYPTDYSSNSIVILRQSPKIHLEKLLKTLRPKLVIADGSNYKSYIKRWKKTCRQQKTPFHATAEKGAFVLSF